MYRILREKSTEKPFTGKYYKHKETGTYNCAGCGDPLPDYNIFSLFYYQPLPFQLFHVCPDHLFPKRHPLQ
ncbi:MAG: hypothetical protein E3J78_03205 [Candidatus Cloacimonadota bacterium]|nr:MAG: hypothetical protein E3J78_03205 [Candidatus Cloacimonadota bacterium]